jgi:hypothetical protein
MSWSCLKFEMREPRPGALPDLHCDDAGACDFTAERTEKGGGRREYENGIGKAVIGYRLGYLLNCNVSRMKDSVCRMMNGLRPRRSPRSLFLCALSVHLIDRRSTLGAGNRRRLKFQNETRPNPALWRGLGGGCSELGAARRRPILRASRSPFCARRRRAIISASNTLFFVIPAKAGTHGAASDCG